MEHISRGGMDFHFPLIEWNGLS